MDEDSIAFQPTSDMNDILPIRMMAYIHDRNKQNITTDFEALYLQFSQESYFDSIVNILLKNNVIYFEKNIIKLIAKKAEIKQHIPDPNAPVFEYDDRYFADCQYTREELYELQSKILELKDSTDLKRDIKKSTHFNDKEIDTCLRQFYCKGLVQRERTDRLEYRYFGIKNEI